MPESPFRYERADDSPGFVLWQLVSLWQGRITAILQSFGLTQTQYAILASLRWLEDQGDRPTQQQLVDHSKIEKMTLSKAVRRLEAGGMVARSTSSQDGRATEVALTPEGRTVIGRAVAAVEDADDQFFAPLDHAELRAWLDLSGTLVASQAGA